MTRFAVPNTVMIDDLSQCTPHGDETSIKKGIRRPKRRPIDLTKRDMKIKLHAVSDPDGRDPRLRDCRPSQ